MNKVVPESITERDAVCERLLKADLRRIDTLARSR